MAEALGDLAVNWKQALSGSPAALAWDLLGDRVRAALRAPAAAGESEALQRMLPPLQADLVILRHKLTLGTAESAGLLGLDVSTVVSNLAAARRTLSGAAAGPGAARRPPC
ncbi:RNA polymerase sigma factor sigma-70 region 4 domain-containing protein [Actinacidiphila yeochonensis]|uniref:sigma-70 region 4 domain-containing protein n=1 Tax=Actinacidiphila yeochonensis TaxID=89050 RepID=UPI000560DB45|nr:sigma-70 region 4 domain-containing protein [Actinacidiphila yeochonensis]